MEYDILSVVAGTEACNAKCPFCVSKMTPKAGLENVVEVNWRNLEKASRLAQAKGVTTAMITGKGEPTLYPELVGEYVRALDEYFPIIELQTNALRFTEPDFEEKLKEWYDDGLSTIAISICHYDDARNQEIYTPKKEYPPLKETIGLLHDIGYSVRLSCVMLDGYIDSAKELQELVDFAREEQVEQVTVRPVNKPEKSRNTRVSGWVNKHQLSNSSVHDIHHHVQNNWVLLSDTEYNAHFYDADGQNVCATNSLTRAPSSHEVRQLIFFPDGHLRYDWQYEGAVIL